MSDLEGMKKVKQALDMNVQSLETVQKLIDELISVKALMVAYKLESRGYKETIEKVRVVFNRPYQEEYDNIRAELKEILKDAK